MDMSQYLEIFIDESKEHLQSMNECLLQLEKDPASDVLNEIFRVAHTLKGMSGTMGFSRMAKLTHDMEDILSILRSGEIKINPELVDLLFQCLDALEKYVDNVVNTSNEGDNDNDDIIRALKNVKDNNQGGAAPAAEKTAAKPVTVAVNSANPTANFQLNEYDMNVINKANEIGVNAFKITVILNKGCLLKSARSFIIFQTLERYSEIIKSEPKVEDIEDEKFDFEFTVVVLSKESQELFNKELNSIAEVEEVIINRIEPGSGAVEAQKASPDAKASASGTDAQKGHEDNKQATGAKKAGKTVRVDIDRLDNLMNLVSELIIIKTRLDGLKDSDDKQSSDEAIEYLERISTSLHDAVMKVRMVPVETVFNRFPRMIRDIAKDLGKEINLIMSGEETELDRTVIDEIGDPLIHCLRNSADHGIESPQKRLQAGKPEAGNIYLRAYQSGNNVIIEVEDDGNGINVEKVRRKAIEKGVINENTAKNMSKKDFVNLLFKPSFSTADKVTDLSGRGVGLDVVKTKIEALGGSIEVETEEGKGSRFIIQLPLTLAIIQALMVMIGQEKYAIPLSNVHKIQYIAPNEIKMVQEQEVILYRNNVIPIIRLDKVLDSKADETPKKQLTVVIVKKGEKLSGFMVDSFIGQQEIVIKSLGKLLQGIKSISGATILGDGNVALILDVNSLA
ncbi:MAG: chemotaxis protein CheA [Bacillota bacterium]|nr:chemotaxis protein CheA [Bacillota bacterium]